MSKKLFPEYKEQSAAKEAVNLHHHGTMPFKLTARHIFQAAQQDIASKKFNGEFLGKRAGELNSHHRKQLGRMRPYGFLPDHVENATDARSLIQNAIDDPGRGQTNKKINTVRIYDDMDRLKEALALCS